MACWHLKEKFVYFLILRNKLSRLMNLGRLRSEKVNGLQQMKNHLLPSRCYQVHLQTNSTESYGVSSCYWVGDYLEVSVFLWNNRFLYRCPRNRSPIEIFFPSCTSARDVCFREIRYTRRKHRTTKCVGCFFLIIILFCFLTYFPKWPRRPCLWVQCKKI